MKYIELQPDDILQRGDIIKHIDPERVDLVVKALAGTMVKDLPSYEEKDLKCVIREVKE